eukprot:3401584-Prorocentrum_lima.AAC.1
MPEPRREPLLRTLRMTSRRADAERGSTTGAATRRGPVDRNSCSGSITLSCSGYRRVHDVAMIIVLS